MNKQNYGLPKKTKTRPSLPSIDSNSTIDSEEEPLASKAKRSKQSENTESEPSIPIPDTDHAQSSST